MKKNLPCLAVCVAVGFSFNVALAGLAVAPGVTTDVLDRIDMIEDESMREMLRAAAWPGFGERHMNLNRPAEELSQFEKNYKAQPLNWTEKIENVRFVLDNADDVREINANNVEYKDIVFGEAVIPVLDRRVKKILATNYFEEEAAALAKEKQEKMAAFHASGETGDGLQKIEDEYAAKLAALVQLENEFKEAKVDFLKLENQKKYDRITADEFNEKTREVVREFENRASLGRAFGGDEVKNMATKIYQTEDLSEAVVESSSEVFNNPISQSAKMLKWTYWLLALLLMGVALLFGYWGVLKMKK